jgi:hypothetical protein
LFYEAYVTLYQNLTEISENQKPKQTNNRSMAFINIGIKVLKKILGKSNAVIYKEANLS